MPPSAKCPECTWRVQVAPESLEAVEQALQQLTAHLSADHDWTWTSAHEQAAQWAASVIEQRPEPSDDH